MGILRRCAPPRAAQAGASLGARFGASEKAMCVENGFPLLSGPFRSFRFLSSFVSSFGLLLFLFLFLFLFFSSLSPLSSLSLSLLSPLSPLSLSSRSSLYPLLFGGVRRAQGWRKLVSYLIFSSLVSSILLNVLLLFLIILYPHGEWMENQEEN